jgi:hypothetical protein
VIEERPTRPAPSAEVRVAGPGADHVKAEDVVLLERRPRSPLGSSLQSGGSGAVWPQTLCLEQEQFLALGTHQFPSGEPGLTGVSDLGEYLDQSVVPE